MISQKLRKPCKVCQEYYVPYSKYQKLCDNCYQKMRNELGQKIKATWKRKRELKCKAINGTT
jgi:hypothetical protein